MKYTFLLLIANSILIPSCKKDDKPIYNASIKAPLSIEFDNIAGSLDLQLNTGTYTNALSESFKVTKLKYYVSNFRLTKTDATNYIVPQDSSYFLIEEGITDDVKLNVPEGEYTSLSFVVGVDSLRNTRDVSRRTGVLDPAGLAKEMYWGLDSGYIFLKLEGTSDAVVSATHAFQYHVGGFGGNSAPSTNNLRTITLGLTARGTPKVQLGKLTNIHLMVDILKMLNGSTNMSFAATSIIHSPLPGVPLANNYINMFRHDHTEN